MSLPTSALADGDTVTLDPIEVTAPSEDCGGRTGSFCSSGGGGGGGGSGDTGGIGGETGFGDGSGGSAADTIKSDAYEIKPSGSNPNDSVTCDWGLEHKIAYAYHEIGKSRTATMFSGRRPIPGEPYTITYVASGETEAWIAGPYIGLSPEIAGAPIPGTCGD